MKLPGFVSRAMSLREAAAVIFVLVALLPLLLFVAFLSVSELITRTEAQFAPSWPSSSPAWDFVVFRRLVDQIARLAVNIKGPISANQEVPDASEAAARLPGLGQVAEIGQLAGAFHQMLEDLRASTQRLEDLVFKLGTLNELVEMSTRIPKIQDLLASVLQSTMRAVHANIGSIMLLDQQRNTLRIVASRGLPGEVHDQRRCGWERGGGQGRRAGRRRHRRRHREGCALRQDQRPQRRQVRHGLLHLHAGARGRPHHRVINLARKEDAGTTPPRRGRSARPISSS